MAGEPPSRLPQPNRRKHRNVVLLKAGSVVVQRGTNHAWANRSGKPCRMLFILVDGRYEASIAAALARR